jgi:AGZA family xanthine/uracil permease-like MFS transporter
LVGFYMMTIAREISWDDYEEAVPAFVTMLAMPFTWSITNGIGAGFITYAAIKLLGGKGRPVHWMVYLASAAFVLYYALPVIEKTVR